nr:DNA (cytosine-5-)-methyltransferase [Mycoplasma sp. Pen4]
MCDLLNQYTFSTDSKVPVSSNYFVRMKEEKLRQIFPYLYSYVNNDYFNQTHKTQKDPNSISSTDITKFTTLPNNIDIFTYSFPCQDLSQQGKQKGLAIGTRSGLLYEIERILKTNKDRLPKVLLLENVKALTTKKFIESFNQWIQTLESLGYKSYTKVLNSSDYGSAQNRERVFCVSILKDSLLKDFEWNNLEIRHNRKLENIIKLDEESKYLDLNKKYKFDAFKTTSNNISKSKLINYTNFNSEAYIYLPKGTGPTLTASGANSRIKFYFEAEDKLKAINSKEAYLYMGFEKNDWKAVKETEIVTETKMIYTCGNSISVEVLEAIFKEILKCLK